tara:strand:+ start:888 stop:2465 length:1578 start_codon:yes stop_codon:yes gene_type:complete
MYRSTNPRQLEFLDFALPFYGHLNPDNRWVTLARLVPWALVEEIYHQSFSEGGLGAPALPARLALGALLIRERLQLSDRETVEAIRENPYLQFFIGRKEFSHARPFDPSVMVDFRQRFGQEGLARISEAIAQASLSQSSISQQPPDVESGSPSSSCSEDERDDSPHPASPEARSSAANINADQPNCGKLIVDATCTPADIRYPTDVSLLNEAREKTDELIDKLHQPLVGKSPRPRTYRNIARRAFVAFTRRKKPKRNMIRRAIGQQLRYLRRNLWHIDQLISNPQALPLSCLNRREFKNLLVAREVFRQQLEMFQTKTQRVDNRIVSFSQPHVRPIKRGKAGRDTEFEAKLSVSVIQGFSFVDRLSWDNYNESLDLIGQIETFRQRFGCYPESVHADQIYRTRKNRGFCKQHGIRLSGPPLGRPQQLSKEQKKQAAADEVIRSTIEGKFVQGKRRFGLGRVMAKLPGTSAAQILLSFLVMNLEQALRLFFVLLTWTCYHRVMKVKRAMEIKDTLTPLPIPSYPNL